MSIENIFKPSLEDVYNCLCKVLPSIENDPNFNLFDSGAIDSLNLLEVIILLEERYSVHFDHENLNIKNFQSLKTIHQAILNLKKGF